MTRTEIKTQDKANLTALLDALDASPRHLGIDDCGDWRITGKRGFIIVWGDNETWVAHISCESKRLWTATKRLLSFCEVTQDGDEEGCVRILALPTPEQAGVLRSRIGLRRRVSAETSERLRQRAVRLFGRPVGEGSSDAAAADQGSAGIQQPSN